ncbi:MAG: hypothetical protein CVU99_09065 [Firmicutes bacterium HGW-Firmicutes-4]|jgi:hypothetical protein|nr:MAG: hypothetical protein CVV25_13380 [Ignavibacteriae bacterium HGW-Ignavibacteriae-4]PKM60246.1 MAG: hypothetical protein CVU99_09065 [Firmicutes bacterium HGW-Firmicutes-4]
MSNLKRLNYIYINTLKIPAFQNIYELSRLTGISSRMLYCLSKNNVEYYKTFTILKKSGDPRTINAPLYSMAIIQKWILRNILEKITPSNRAMAFRKGSEFGCKMNAKYHVGTLYGLSIDLADFFTSIKSNKVYCLFRNLGYAETAATILTNICTLDGALPQGGVCSPTISNLICITLDNRLIGMCEKRGIRYTRYADDMYFSCDNKDLLKKTFPKIKTAIEDQNFTINNNKTRYHTPSNRNQITGVVIVKTNQYEEYELKAKRKLKQSLRAEIHNAIMTGDYKNKGHILGIISYINFVEKENSDNYLERIKEYIVKCANKIIFFEELIKAYNENLFFNNMEKIAYDKDQIVDFFKEEDSYLKLLDKRIEREAYLQKYHRDDICMYLDWPRGLDPNNNNDIGLMDDCPF